MALYRDTPKCGFCGEVTHKAKYRDQSHIPMEHRLIGDTFEGWEDLNHTCPDKEAFYAEIGKTLDKVWNGKKD